jgi:hypothetical protein
MYAAVAELPVAGRRSIEHNIRINGLTGSRKEASEKMSKKTGWLERLLYRREVEIKVSSPLAESPPTS